MIRIIGLVESASAQPQGINSPDDFERIPI